MKVAYLSVVSEEEKKQCLYSISPGSILQPFTISNALAIAHKRVEADQQKHDEERGRLTESFLKEKGFQLTVQSKKSSNVANVYWKGVSGGWCLILIGSLTEVFLVLILGRVDNC